MMGLSKEETVENHRDLWDWLAQNPQAEKEDWPDWEEKFYGYDYEELDDYSHCFLCMFAQEDCGGCPVEWPGRNCGTNLIAKSPYIQWQDAHDDADRTKYAIIIRDLPERVPEGES